MLRFRAPYAPTIYVRTRGGPTATAGELPAATATVVTAMILVSAAAVWLFA